MGTACASVCTEVMLQARARYDSECVAPGGRIQRVEAP
jgi:hypothetical protein